ncbi:MAG: DUF5615 family PIN-like protein [Firmicutes bacterium]|nr:DUF5615 family PIN-like protein [Bacillota bacterium]
MKFLADESIDLPIVESLRRDGHVTLYVVEMEPGIKDDEVLKDHYHGALSLPGGYKR